MGWDRRSGTRLSRSCCEDSSPEDLLGEEGLFKQLKKKLLETPLSVPRHAFRAEPATSNNPPAERSRRPP
jgi:hypothetical protein